MIVLVEKHAWREPDGIIAIYYTPPNYHKCVGIGTWDSNDRYVLAWDYRQHIIIDTKTGNIRQLPRTHPYHPKPILSGNIKFSNNALCEQWAIMCCKIANENEIAWNKFFNAS